MTRMAYQQFYQGFLNANKGKQHYACHSHYFWPDCTRDAMVEYWDDSAKYVDAKWGFFFDTLIPEVRQNISKILNTSHPQQIVFAPNTHELIYRIISCLDMSSAFTVVTTDSEFHSFHRQISRLAESGNINVIRVATEPFATFPDRFIQAIEMHSPNLIFFSQVFFNSGFAINGEQVRRIVESISNPDSFVVVDGYHGFMAKPTDLSAIEERVFYVAGSYKYAQAGEGACFAHIPNGCQLRPSYTGWFAEFGALDKPRQGSVQYSNDGMRFAGATMDFSALYRLRAVFRLLHSHHISIEEINNHVMEMQDYFLAALDEQKHPLLNSRSLVVNDSKQRGHFLAFNLPDSSITQKLFEQLKQTGILTDYRGNRLRFGFGLYHTKNDIVLDAISQL